MPSCTKPCPGCKTTNHRRGSAENVCWHCAELLKEAIAARERAVKIERRRKELYWIPVAPHNFPYLRAGRETELTRPEGISDRFTRAFHDLAQIVGREVGRRSVWQTKANPVVLPEASEGIEVIELEMPDDAANALATLYAMMIRNAEVCRAEGFADGRNILNGLMAGTLSTAAAEDEEKSKVVQPKRRTKRR